MLAADKASLSEITLGGLIDRLSNRETDALLFVHDGRALKPGYHVTEVKTGRFMALDCGSNPEAWTETFVQLWDVDEEQRMTAGKFVGIIGKASGLSSIVPESKLTFEVSDGVAPIQLYRADAVVQEEGRAVVHLVRRAASCKPRDRELATEAAAASCCSSAVRHPCCG